MFDSIINDIAASKRGSRIPAVVFLVLVCALVGAAMTALEDDGQKIALLLAGLLALPGFVFLVNAVTPVSAHPLVKQLESDPSALRKIDATAILRNNAHVAWRLTYLRADGSKIWTSQLAAFRAARKTTSSPPSTGWANATSGRSPSSRGGP